jgi:hypothetical protein
MGTHTLATVAVLRGHTERVTAFVWARNGRAIVSAGRNGTLTRWAVVVPNATAANPSAERGAGALAAAYPPHGAGDVAVSPPTGGLHTAQSPAQPTGVGRQLQSVELRDVMPTAVTSGHADDGSDVFVAGAATRDGVTTAVLCHVLMTQPALPLQQQQQQQQLPQKQ